MKRHFRLFLLYFAQYAKVRLAYKADFIIAFFSSMAATVLGFGFVLVLFSKISRLQDWSFNELMFLYGFSLIPLGLFNVVSWNLYDFGELYVIEGRFDRVLLRPVDSLFQVIFEKFRLESLQEVVTGVAVVTVCLRRMHLSFHPADYFWFALMVVCGSVIYLSVFLILTAVSFWFEDRVGIVPPVFNMLNFGRYPLTIYNVFIQFLLSWIIPFGFASFYPTTHFLGRKAFTPYFHLVPVVAGGFFALALFVWKKGVENYASTGS
jgi:viologen exporter family transport system permease protein